MLINENNYSLYYNEQNNFLVKKNEMLKTGDKILVENAPYDYIWGCGKKGYGKNKLGLALMEIRTILKNNL